MVQNKVKHFLFCCGVKAQPFQNDFGNIITIVSVSVKMAAVLILGITARLSDVVQQQCYLNSNVLARIVGNCMSDVVINGVLVVFVVLSKPIHGFISGMIVAITSG